MGFQVFFVLRAAGFQVLGLGVEGSRSLFGLCKGCCRP